MEKFTRKYFCMTFLLLVIASPAHAESSKTKPSPSWGLSEQNDYEQTQLSQVLEMVDAGVCMDDAGLQAHLFDAVARKSEVASPSDVEICEWPSPENAAETEPFNPPRKDDGLDLPNPPKYGGLDIRVASDECRKAMYDKILATTKEIPTKEFCEPNYVCQQFSDDFCKFVKEKGFGCQIFGTMCVDKKTEQGIYGHAVNLVEYPNVCQDTPAGMRTFCIVEPQSVMNTQCVKNAPTPTLDNLVAGCWHIGHPPVNPKVGGPACKTDLLEYIGTLAQDTLRKIHPAYDKQCPKSEIGKTISIHSLLWISLSKSDPTRFVK